jgi:hypothetical protein
MKFKIFNLKNIKNLYHFMMNFSKKLTIKISRFFMSIACYFMSTKDHSWDWVRYDGDHLLIGHERKCIGGEIRCKLYILFLFIQIVYMRHAIWIYETCNFLPSHSARSMNCICLCWSILNCKMHYIVKNKSRVLSNDIWTNKDSKTSNTPRVISITGSILKSSSKCASSLYNVFMECLFSAFHHFLCFQFLAFGIIQFLDLLKANIKK